MSKMMLIISVFSSLINLLISNKFFLKQQESQNEDRKDNLDVFSMLSENENLLEMLKSELFGDKLNIIDTNSKPELSAKIGNSFLEETLDKVMTKLFQTAAEKIGQKPIVIPIEIKKTFNFITITLTDCELKNFSYLPGQLKIESPYTPGKLLARICKFIF